MNTELLRNKLASSFYASDAPIFTACCVGIWIGYRLLETEFKAEKSKAWIVMLMASFTLSLCGVVHVARTIVNDAWTMEAIYTEDQYSRCIILFFTATNVMDLVLGVNHYPKYLDPLSTIMHHIFYMIFMVILMSYHYCTGFQLCFLMEVPTFVLALGTVNKEYRSDLLFGITFMITRIFYNILLAYQLYVLSPEGMIWKTCVGVLCLHMYWFYKWYTVYGKEAFSLDVVVVVEHPQSHSSSHHHTVSKC